MTDTNAPIGVFDSGIGGLTVMKEIMHQIPDEKIIYFGDTARVPYGRKSREPAREGHCGSVQYGKCLCAG